MAKSQAATTSEDLIPIPVMKEILVQMINMRPRRSVFLWGAPGIGKTSIVFQTGSLLDYDVYELRLGEHDPVDLRGMPVPVLIMKDGTEIYLNQPMTDGVKSVEVNIGVTKWFIPHFFAFSEKPIILFLDEMNQSDRAVQKVAQRLVLQYKIGDYTLPPNVVVVAAGNRESDRAFVQKMAAPTLNRFFHYEVGVDVDGWVEWAEQNGIHPMVIAFIKFKPDMLFQFDPHSSAKAFPTPRTWEFVSDALNAGQWVGLYYTIQGAVGKAAAIEFKGFLDIHADIPDIESIFTDPTNTQLPSNPSVRFSLCVLLANRANYKNLAAIRTYVERMGREYCAYTVKCMTRIKSDLAETPEFIQWAIDYQQLLVDDRTLKEKKTKKQPK